MTASAPPLPEVAAPLAMDLESGREIKINPYCTIYLAQRDGAPLILKRYHEAGSKLAILEAENLEFYSNFVNGRPGWMSSRTLAFDSKTSSIAIEFVEGEPFSAWLRRSFWNKSVRPRCLAIARELGAFLRDLHAATKRPGQKFDPHLSEYLEYCSTRLAQSKLFGRWFRRPVAATRELWSEFRSCGLAPSFAHGDLVCINVHATEEKLGLIDLANCKTKSHLLDDLFNLTIGIANMRLPRAWTREILRALHEGIGPIDAPDAAVQFFWEFHRRRWLMLKLRARNPLRIAEGLRGWWRFGRKSAREMLDP